MDTKDKDLFDELFGEPSNEPNWPYGVLLAISAVVAAVMVLRHFMG